MSDPCTLFGAEACTACDPRSPSTPLSLINRPGLSSLSYRVGTFSTFRAAMLDQIASARVVSIDPDNTIQRPHVLTSGASDDYAIAMLELWGYVCDVLTMYQQAYANEAFVRTATLPESLQRIAGLIGYSPARGVAAKAVLAYIADAGAILTVPTGLQFQSIPPPGGTPQVFENSAALAISAATNTLTLTGPPRSVTFGNSAEIFAANSGNTPIGAKLVFQLSGTTPVAETTVVGSQPTPLGTRVFWGADLTSVSGSIISANRWNRKFRWFGYNAPDTYPTPTISDGSVTWTSGTTTISVPAGYTLFLDSVYDGIGVGARILVVTDDINAQIVTVQASTQGFLTVGPMSATVTKLTVSQPLPAITSLRTVAMYELLGPPLAFVQNYYPDFIDCTDPMEAGMTIYVTDDSAVHKGTQLLLVQAATTGTNSDLVAVSAEPTHIGPPFPLKITPPLSNNYTPSQTTVYANIGTATAGQTQVEQILGDGDGTLEWQEFELSPHPLTYVANSGAGAGTASTLQVLVDGIAWTEVPSFYGRGPDEVVFTTREDEDGNTFVRFGNGLTGRRLPTGTGNVHAFMRKGLGSAGNVAPQTITTIVQQYPGLKAVTNPLGASGGQDADAPDSIRTNAPPTVATLGRAVSLRDYSALAVNYPGVAKANASWSDFSSRRGVTLTVVAAAGTSLTQIAPALRSHLDTLRDPNVPLAIAEATKVAFAFGATVAVKPTYLRPAVAAAATAALGPTAAGGWLSFDQLAIGRSIYQSELLTVLQSVPGVEYVKLTRFSAFDPTHAFGGDPNRIDVLYLSPTDMAWPSLTGNLDTTSVNLNFTGGITASGSGT